MKLNHQQLGASGSKGNSKFFLALILLLALGLKKRPPASKPEPSESKRDLRFMAICLLFSVLAMLVALWARQERQQVIYRYRRTEVPTSVKPPAKTTQTLKELELPARSINDDYAKIVSDAYSIRQKALCASGLSMADRLRYLDHFYLYPGYGRKPGSSGWVADAENLRLNRSSCSHYRASLIHPLADNNDTIQVEFDFYAGPPGRELLFRGRYYSEIHFKNGDWLLGETYRIDLAI